MNRLGKFIASAGIGAGLMYYFDAQQGRRRRALVKDQASHLMHNVVDGMDATRRDVGNRVRGFGAGMRSWVLEGKVSDDVIAERVRSVIGRVVSHPGSIDVNVMNGHVVLSGPILVHEVDDLFTSVYRVRGVRGVEDRLEVHTQAGNVPGLQGQPVRRAAGRRFEFMQANWSPAARLTAGLAGLMGTAYGFGRRGIAGTITGSAGLLLFGRAAMNMPVKRLVGIGSGRRGLDIQKTMHINAPVERVFETWANFQNFPQFMTHVREVQEIEDNRKQRRWRWTVTGPAGTTTSFDTVVTAFEVNRQIAWRTEPGSIVQHSGLVKFLPNADGTTTVDLRFTYNPIAGAAGHAVAWLLGADAKHQLDDDLMRMKSYLETGVPPHDAAQRPRPAL